jgi:hypothetical protein
MRMQCRPAASIVELQGAVTFFSALCTESWSLRQTEYPSRRGKVQLDSGPALPVPRSLWPLYRLQWWGRQMPLGDANLVGANGHAEAARSSLFRA